MRLLCGEIAHLWSLAIWKALLVSHLPPPPPPRPIHRWRIQCHQPQRRRRQPILDGTQTPRGRSPARTHRLYWIQYNSAIIYGCNMIMALLTVKWDMMETPEVTSGIYKQTHMRNKHTVSDFPALKSAFFFSISSLALSTWWWVLKRVWSLKPLMTSSENQGPFIDDAAQTN